ncbi:zinc-ribbon domain-containing protein [Lichenihabitans sp. PAMC28606]|uniref:zinc-ribbon domain-containing protein n=1 Tax=Lichenihabitans sp. PAMC28606 TaxID=2880932 RepID=UPI001D0B5C66|nr:zinc-ribbon domain-containing protein [Lichenihabitans sp. PAMC28606]UDL93361.1 zinc-ribbon domain-containing protein [Lichenihabitans sp. PAMC28606]
MRIICPTCAIHYDIDADNITAAGQLVRCGDCRDVWLVRPGDEPARPARPEPQNVVGEPTSSDPFVQCGWIPAPPQPSAPSNDRADRPIDFNTARARLRPQPGQMSTGATVRTTLGAIAIGLFGIGSVVAAIGVPLIHKGAIRISFGTAAPAPHTLISRPGGDKGFRVSFAEGLVP